MLLLGLSALCLICQTTSLRCEVILMKNVRIVLAVLLISGCAHTTGVLPMDGGQFMLSNRGHSPFASMQKVRQNARDKAAEHCKADGKKMVIVEIEEEIEAGTLPKSDLIFKCV